VSSLSLSAPAVPSAFSFSVLGGVGVDDARDVQYDSQLGVSLQRGRLQVGLFSRLSVPNQGGIQSAKRGLQNDPVCNIDTNNDGVIDASDCDNPSNPGDPTDPCAPDANGVVGPNCPAVTDCTVDTNGDNIIDDSDCKSTTPNNASSYSLSVGADVAVPFVVGSFSVTPGLSLRAAHRAEDSLSLRGGVSLTTSTKVHQNLSLDLRLSLDSTRSGATFLSTGLGFHWQRE
jgi:hypothetical protein